MERDGSEHSEQTEHSEHSEHGERTVQGARVEHSEREASGVARSRNVVYVVPHDAAAVAQLMAAALERVDAEGTGVQLLVAASDADVAVQAAGAAALAPAPAPAVAVTGLRRGSRRLRTAAPAVVAGTPAELLALVRESVLKLDGVRAVVIAWADALLERGEMEALEGLFAELPREAARILATARVTPGVEELIERYARRARRMGDLAPTADGAAPVALRVMAVPAAGRAAAVRRLLDVVDPERAVLVARSEAGAREADELARSLGGPGASVQVARAAADAEGADLSVLYELPATREELRSLVAAADTTVALVQPRQLAGLRAIAGGALLPMALPEAATRARAHEAAARSALRDILAHEVPAREMLALEPLLEEYDGVEIAAAALRLLEREREAHARESQAREAREREALERGREEREAREGREGREGREREGRTREGQEHEGGEPRAPENSARMIGAGEPRARSAPRSTARGTAEGGSRAAGGARGERRGASGDGATARLFVNVGERDGAGPGDLVGAIANEAHLRGDRIGRVEVRETHSLVEVPADDAEAVAEALTGVVVRGRRVAARVDRERAPHERAPRERAPRERTPRERASRDYPPRERHGAGRVREERPTWGNRPARGEREERGRVGQGDRSGRGDRYGHADRDARAERGDRERRFDRGERGDRFARGAPPERRERGARDDRPAPRRTRPPRHD